MALIKTVTKIWPVVFLLLFASISFGAEALIAIKPDWDRGRVQDGAIVDIRSNNFKWGNLEKKKFMIIKVDDKMLTLRDEIRKPLVEKIKYDGDGNPNEITNGRLKYVYEYWNHLSASELQKVRKKKENNIYTQIEISSSIIKVKDANNTTTGNLSIISSP